MQSVSKNRGDQNTAGTTVQCTPVQSAINAIIVVNESHCYHYNRSPFNFHHRHNYKRKQAIALNSKFGGSDLHENENKMKTRNLKGIAIACKCAIPTHLKCHVFQMKLDANLNLSQMDSWISSNILLHLKVLSDSLLFFWIMSGQI